MALVQNGVEFQYFRTTKNGYYIYADKNGFLYYRRKNGEFRQISYLSKDNKVQRLTVKDILEKKRTFYLGTEKVEAKDLKAEATTLDFNSTKNRCNGDVNNVISNDPTTNQTGELEIMTKVGTLTGNYGNGINGCKDIYIDKNGFLYLAVAGGFLQLSYYDTKTGIEVPITEKNFDTVGGRLNYYQENPLGVDIGRTFSNTIVKLSPLYLDSENKFKEKINNMNNINNMIKS